MTALHMYADVGFGAAVYPLSILRNALLSQKRASIFKNPMTKESHKAENAELQEIYLEQNPLSVQGFSSIVFGDSPIHILPHTYARLEENHQALLASAFKFQGGAPLGLGMGKDLPLSVVKGAMVLFAWGHTQGSSGLPPQALETLLQMINANIIPVIPDILGHNSIGEQKFLTCLFRALEGKAVPVVYKGNTVMAYRALALESIEPYSFSPQTLNLFVKANSLRTSQLFHAILRQENLLHAMEEITGISWSEDFLAPLTFAKNVALQESRIKLGEVVLLSGDQCLKEVDTQHLFSHKHQKWAIFLNPSLGDGYSAQALLGLGTLTLQMAEMLKEQLCVHEENSILGKEIGPLATVLFQTMGKSSACVKSLCHQQETLQRLLTLQMLSELNSQAKRAFLEEAQARVPVELPVSSVADIEELHAFSEEFLKDYWAH